MNFHRRLERELNARPVEPPEAWVEAGVTLSDEDFLKQMEELKKDDGFQAFVSLVALNFDTLADEQVAPVAAEEIEQAALDLARTIARFRYLTQSVTA